MKKMTREWVRKAEADFRLAVQTASGSEPFHDQICFHCQQAAEKYLKALLEELGLAIPKTHVLIHLLTLLLPHHDSLKSQKRGLVFLTKFAVGARYPLFSSTKAQAEASLRWAGRVRDACRTLLGIRPRTSRRSPSP